MVWVILMSDDYNVDDIDGGNENDPHLISIIKDELYVLMTEIEELIEDDTQPYADEHGVSFLNDIKYSLLELRSRWG